ncbi:MAG TPA: hypothetical protein ENG00_00065 [Candidatus Aenigmarchaeota archaeon]|nr:hypothetical protein [Candidatus Aenigmarchaeota archaeon]
MKKAQMFIITMVFLVGLLSAVQTYLRTYSAVDISEIMKNNDIYLFENMKEVVNFTVTSTSSCSELKSNLEELEFFLERYKLFGYTMNIDFSLNCNYWYNSPPQKPPVKMSIEIERADYGSKSSTKGYYRIYRSGITP